MKATFQFYRLQLLWFTLLNFAAIGVVVAASLVFGIFVKLAGYGCIFFMSRMFSCSYDYFFLNLGYSIRRLFLVSCLFDFCLFFILIYVVKIVT